MTVYKWNPMGLGWAEAEKLQDRFGKNELVQQKICTSGALGIDNA